LVGFVWSLELYRWHVATDMRQYGRCNFTFLSSSLLNATVKELLKLIYICQVIITRKSTGQGTVGIPSPRLCTV